MLSVTRFEQGVDRSCDAEVARWFGWRFPTLEMRQFIACRDWPYKHVHHIVEMAGNAHVFVNLQILPRQLVPGPARRTRHTHQFIVRRVNDQRLHVSMLMWLDAPLPDAHPLAKLCPSRWPIVDEESASMEGAPVLFASSKETGL